MTDAPLSPDTPHRTPAPRETPLRAAVVVAAGRGLRAGGGLAKQWRMIGAQRVIDHTLAALSPHVDLIVVVTRPEDAARIAPLCDGARVIQVNGGKTRAASVRAGLEALVARKVDQVLIHDAARACVPAVVIETVVQALDHAQGAAPALAVTDALWRGTQTPDGPRVSGTQQRDGLWRAQTPQGFHFTAILEAHRQVADLGADLAQSSAADDVAVARAAGLDVAIVAGHEDNFKITQASDFDRAYALLARSAPATPAQETAMDMRVGTGFDVHSFVEGDHLWLCGLKIAHSHGLNGHSDSDVGMHALTDAIYGALAQGDIGQHFPPSDMQWKGAPSDIFLRHAVDLAQEMGYRISNCDVTLICERPKIGPHAQAMRARLAQIMGLEVARVSVKATTSEKLGFTGRGEGIAAQASALLISL
ncbi:Bifunctional enzyme IspD/IspF [Aquimixticola soesokkakensis]|uniref:Bifunctional enzyme IspD/IspF n=1 Tax=Aquimixticola soesokkakensis TaxID=1519096 RepID=A0A1Y5SLH9_9RHOB|nr:bifunctional 2-C-methyl-D-erythritol 4-phosphate cytidylyltransferase/2-C-methyl-D-erythritol 2,4-cyclodiphosphate synthase [Aquimixticola soesokkakensis]SLN41762.1 Bifunctional enzyme IspD/IspF [Aquimixticola soesokkakensis]